MKRKKITILISVLIFLIVAVWIGYRYLSEPASFLSKKVISINER
ncbi:hypothetical protein SAMN04487943_106256 [Gracilibacillus orientalis]|uniref:Uncharacterized protein n=1 Tax=Gracilibacillus orientalis TaxID=334253 RepID=A0A1I4MH00_9BACI|nr:hypothetical protein [Gracilibacillus orientalis]SFM02504.1 hypothetical protein SAMN04487943_106256 [Gracilibacillus orientalis]